MISQFILDSVIALLSVCGLMISVYFSAVYYRWLDPTTPLVPAFCRLDEHTCIAVLHTAEAKVFGVLNALFGIAYYTGVLIAVLAGFMVLGYSLFPFIWGITGLTALFSIWLTWALFVRLSMSCPSCLICHCINLLLFALLTIR